MLFISRRRVDVVLAAAVGQSLCDLRFIEVVMDLAMGNIGSLPGFTARPRNAHDAIQVGVIGNNVGIQWIEFRFAVARYEYQ